MPFPWNNSKPDPNRDVDPYLENTVRECLCKKKQQETTPPDNVDTRGTSAQQSDPDTLRKKGVL